MIKKRSAPRVLRVATNRKHFVKWMGTKGWTRDEALRAWKAKQTTEGIRTGRLLIRDDAIYRALRDYQDGKFDATSGISAGKLGVALTTAYDKIRKAASNV